jgi:probable rRNA maturation factor
LSIVFLKEGINYNLSEKLKVKNWIKYVVSSEGKTLGNLNYVFSSDEYVIEINKKYLQHDYYTDIITFNYNEGIIVSGDIVISIDMVRENALKFSNSFEAELHRVIIHGVLHLIGYDDKTEKLKLVMRSMEDKYLGVLYSKFLIK